MPSTSLSFQNNRLRRASQRRLLICPTLGVPGRGRGSVLPDDAFISDHAKETMRASLPADPNDLLTEDQKSTLAADLAKLARLRRDAEIASATLRLA